MLSHVVYEINWEECLGRVRLPATGSRSSPIKQYCSILYIYIHSRIAILSIFGDGFYQPSSTLCGIAQKPPGKKDQYIPKLLMTPVENSPESCGFDHHLCDSRPGPVRLAVAPSVRAAWSKPSERRRLVRSESENDFTFRVGSP